MYSISSNFISTLRSPSMQAVALVQASNGTTLTVSSGSVSLDSRRNITRTCELELLPDDTYTLNALYDLVMTPSVELSVYRGLMVNGSPEYVPLGVFSTDTARTSTDSISWSGSDRSKKIQRARLTDTYAIASGTLLANAATALLQSRWSQVETDFSNISETINAPITYEAGESSDPWAQLRSLFAEYGYDLHFNGAGVAVATVIPDPATVAAAFDFGTGETNLVLDGEISGTFEGVYNGVVVTGEGSNVDTPVQAVVWDTDPSSPTYYLSGFGLAPKFYSSPLLTTVDMCTTAANTILSKGKGRSEQLSVASVVNPSLEPLDVVTAVLNDNIVRFVIDQITIPLRASDGMSLTARQTST